MREIIKSGFLGGPPVHMESVWGYSYNDPGYTKAILGDKQHWVRNLPGKLLHNIISHGVSKIAEFLTCNNPKVVVYGFTGPFLINHNESNIIDELRAIIYDDHSTTAYFTFSTLMSPIIHQFRIFGPKNSIIVDDLHQTVIKVTKNYTSYLNHFIPPLVDAKQYLMNSMNNIRRFVKRELYFEEGRKYLIEAFYRSVSNDAPLPISYREILLTSKILDAIFEQLESQKGKSVRL
jgi:predicted dehydrogenase